MLVQFLPYASRYRPNRQASLIITLSITLRAIFAGGHAEPSQKGPAQRLGAGEAAFERNQLQRPRCRVEKLARSCKPRHFNELCGRHPSFLHERAREIALTHTGLAGELGD